VRHRRDGTGGVEGGQSIEKRTCFGPFSIEQQELRALEYRFRCFLFAA
jgi:hypothetical protein